MRGSILLQIGFYLAARALASAQQPEASFRVVQQRYMDMQACSAKISTQFYKSSSDTRAARTLDASTKFSEAGSHSVNGAVEVLSNDRCVLIIDHVGKTIQYSASSGKGLKKDLDQRRTTMLQALDSAFFNRYTIQQLDGSANLLRFRITPVSEKETDFLQADLSFDAETYGLRQIEYIMKPGSTYQKVRIQYTYLDMAPQFSEGAFSEAKFLDGQGDKAALKEAFKGYTFYNLYSKTIKDFLSDEE